MTRRRDSCLESSSHKVLIDALFDNPNPNYRAPSEDMLEQLLSGKAPFDDVDLALVHYWFPLHPDGARIIQEVLKPEHVGLIHLPIRLESDTPNKIDAVKSNYKDIFLFVDCGEKKIIR